MNRAVRKRLGTRKASFASAEETRGTHGHGDRGVTPFGTSTPLPVWIDAAVMERSQLIIGGGSRDRKLLVPPTTLASHPLAEVVEGLARPIGD
ncbi:MAG: YbaK/EbsC family protein [Acidimicrobiales bacterium]